MDGYFAIGVAISKSSLFYVSIAVTTFCRVMTIKQKPESSYLTKPSRTRIRVHVCSVIFPAITSNIKPTCFLITICTGVQPVVQTFLRAGTPVLVKWVVIGIAPRVSGITSTITPPLFAVSRDYGVAFINVGTTGPRAISTISIIFDLVIPATLLVFDPPGICKNLFLCHYP